MTKYWPARLRINGIIIIFVYIERNKRLLKLNRLRDYMYVQMYSNYHTLLSLRA